MCGGALAPDAVTFSELRGEREGERRVGEGIMDGPTGACEDTHLGLGLRVLSIDRDY